MVLPNALITEFGVINYLHTLYSNKNKTDSFFDNQGGEQSPNKLIFDNNLGSWPNSLRSNGSHLNSAMYKDYLTYHEQSLYFGKKILDKYIYPIKVNPHLDDFIGFNLRPGNKLNGEYFWKHMSAEALQDAQQGKALIFLDYAQENFIEKQTYQNLHEVLKLSGIPKTQVLLAFNSFNAQEVYESWFTPEERRLEVRDWPFVMAATSRYYSTCDSSRLLDVAQFESTSSTIRDNYFLFKIRNTRPHRLALLYKMSSDCLLDKGDWSCLTPVRFSENEVIGIANRYNFDIDSSAINQLCKNLPHLLQNEKDITYSEVSAWTDQHTHAHKNSYFYICTETFVHGPHKSLTEKVFKPIANFQPFIFVAYPGALQLLRNLGFKTFEPFIDESYDTELDETLRLQLIYKEINRLCAMSKQEIHDWYWRMKDILIYNHYHLLTLHNAEPKSLELIKYLYQRSEAINISARNK